MSRQWTWPAFKARLLHSKKPILVGPWRSEVGFEALYWLPFLEKLKREGIAPERLIPISRGGAACWYGTPQGLELFAMRTPQQVRVENRVQHKRTGMLKQLTITNFDRGVLADAAATLGIENYHVLHPSWMYHLFTPYWELQAGAQMLDRYTAWSTLPPPPLPDTIHLPETFVAVRFYFRTTFPNSKQAQQMATACVGKIAAQLPVVVLHSDAHLDDHADLELAKIPNVTLLRDLIPLNPETNLAVQSAVLARSHAFVGTYGGFAQLALRFGRSVVSFYDQWQGTSIAHKFLAETISLQTGVPFQVVSLHELPFVSAVLPQAVVRTVTSPQHLDMTKGQSVVA